MSGGIVQLVATGAQDTWLTGKPEVSFYRSSYKRYTHYAMSSERQLIQGSPAAGNISTIRFEKKGDLMNYIYFSAKDTSGALIPGVDWSKVIDKIDLLIGGQVIDTQDINWMTQIEPVTGAQNYSQRYLNNDTDGLTNVINGFLPLKFFFCKDWNVSLPLVALQYHDIELRITWSANLGYRVGYELYTAPVASSTATIPTPAAATYGIAKTNSPTGVTTFSGLTVTIVNATITASQQYQTTPFTYTNAAMQIVPGMYFTTALNNTPNIIVVSVTPTSSTSGTFIGYMSVANSTSTSINDSRTLAGYQDVVLSAGSFTVTGGLTLTAAATYSSVGITWSAGTTAPTVNSVMTAQTPGTNGSFGTNAMGYISAITYVSSTSATINIAVISPTSTGQVNFSSGANTSFTTFYPIINLVLSAAATGGTVAAGQTLLGGAAVVNVPNPTVNTVYSSTVLSLNTNQFQPFVQTGAAAAIAPRTAAQLNTTYSSATDFWFVPTNYYTGLVDTASLATIQAGNQGSAVLAVAAKYSTFNGANTTTNVIPPVNGSVYFFNAGQTMTNVYVGSSTSNVSFGINYSAAGTTTAVVQNAQFVIIPQASARGMLSAAQPYVDREGSAIIQATNIAGNNLAVGQQVIGTQYTGPVTISQIVTTGGTPGAGTGTATLEITFPVQTTTVFTTTSGMITFIDPAASLPLGFTVSTVGFNGTYAQLQYEAWTNFVYLDQAEREFFANTPMDMLITQVNRVPIAAANMQELALAHPIKFIAFLANNYSTAYQTQATTGIPASSYYFKTQINGVDIGDSRSLFQWQDVPHYYHTPFGYKASGATASVGLIPYCLDTSKLQPTGTLNFSRIDTYRIVAPAGVNLTTISGGNNNYFYAMNYNVLRIKDGMSGLLYSN